MVNAFYEYGYEVHILSIYKENKNKSCFFIHPDIKVLFYYDFGVSCFDKYKYRNSKNIFKSLYFRSIQKRIRDFKVKK